MGVSRTLKLLIVSLFGAALLGFGAVSIASESVKLHISGSGSPFPVIFRVGQERGFYKDENLEVLAIAANLLTGIQGLTAGSFDFSQILGQGSAAILRGFPLKVVMAFDRHPLWWLYGAKQVKNLRDLKGRQVAVASFGSAVHQTTQEILAKHGIDPARDVALRAVGNDPDRLAALLSGAIGAAVLNQTSSLAAKKNGLHELLFYGKEIEYVTAGVVVAEKTLSQKPDFVRRFLSGTLRSFLWVKANEREMVRTMARLLKVSEGEAGEIYHATVEVLSVDGTIPRALQERMIAFQRAALKVEKEVPAETVYDFSLLEAINRESGKRSR